MEYVIGACCGVAVLINLYFFRRRLRRQKERGDFHWLMKRGQAT